LPFAPVVLDETLSSAQNRSGDKFQASLASPVVIDDKTVIPQNSRVFGHVVDARPSGRLRGVARLDLTLDTVEVDGKSYDIATADRGRVGKNHNKRNGILIGGGAGLGAIIGGVATGGVGAVMVQQPEPTLAQPAQPTPARRTSASRRRQR
jgi:hypothetical protein